ncbi:hypothetical protein QBC46DRAFT_343719 [Diplogelasinospora grovesii]|uniref:Uncharacterized protein n=1 Tax=Diplogelasinospora grovesii TaxID=303347 RepID=A0AAN6N355_9PEZI|nr:hypothetical protein QBC46DRAFT_343719 [Diplogelasinospora grovesii]
MLPYNIVLVLLASLVGVAQGFAAPGAAERLMFYYAYLMDLKMNNNVPRFIAPGCTPSPCNLNDFLKYISSKDTTIVPIDVPGMNHPEVPDLRGTYNKLMEQGENMGPINLKKLLPENFFKGNKPVKYSDALQHVTGVITHKASQHQARHDALKQRGMDSVRLSLVARLEAKSDYFWKKHPYYIPALHLAPLFPGAQGDDVADIISFSRTAYENKNRNISAEELEQEYEKTKSKGDGHKANIEVLEQALKDLTEGC